MGPFVSEEHPLVCSVTSPFELFQNQIILPLLDMLSSQQSLQIILIPSCKDIMHPSCVYPQPPLPLLSLLKESAFNTMKYKSELARIICLPNPCVFAINECCIGIQSDDVLLELSKEEISRVPNNSLERRDRMSRLVRHFLTQRRYT